MDLLRYEFTNAPEGSYNYNLSQLIKMVRYYRSISIEEFHAAMPELKKMQQWLQNVDKTIMADYRNYLEDIMSELEEEDAVTGGLADELERHAKAVVSALFKTEFLIGDVIYELNNKDGIFWLEFHGCTDKNTSDEVLSVIKEAFRFVCYKSGIVFIDKS